MSDRYFAGLFDGEGFVRINKWKKPGSVHVRYQVICGLGMTHRPVIELMQRTYGGSINQNRHDLRNPKHRIQFTWNVGSQRAAAFLRRVFPYLIVKKDEAEIALALQNHIDSTAYKSAGRSGKLRKGGKQILATRDKMYHDILALKKRSYPPLTRKRPQESVN